MSRTLFLFIALLLLFCGSGILWLAGSNPLPPGSVSEKDPDYTPPQQPLTEFEFRDQLNKPFSSKDLEGKVWMGSFFFASCPTICRQQNAEIAKIHRRFIDDDVMIVNITVDPEQDTPVVLLQYAELYDADHDRWKFLTTEKGLPYVRKVGSDILSLAAAEQTHSSSVVLFNKQGEQQGAYKITDSQEFTRLVMKVEELLAAEETQAVASAGTGQPVSD